MFCKNCGREIELKTLERLTDPSGGAARCSNCGQELDTAEFCGGFWGLAASGLAMEGGTGGGQTGKAKGGQGRTPGGSGSRKDAGMRSRASGKGLRIPGVTDADRALARVILQGEGEERTSAALQEDDWRGCVPAPEDEKHDNERPGLPKGGAGNPERPGRPKGGAGNPESPGLPKGGANDLESAGKGKGKSGLVLFAAAALAGLLVGRFLLPGIGSGKTAGADSYQAEEGVQTGTETTGKAERDIPDQGRTGREAGSLSSGIGSQAAGETQRPADPGYTVIRRRMTEAGETRVEDAILYLGGQDSGIRFEGEPLRDEWYTSAGDTGSVKREIRESDGRLKEIREIFCDKEGEESNNAAGYCRVKYEYDEEGRLEKKKYYAMTGDGGKSEKICTAVYAVTGIDGQEAAVELFEPASPEEDAAVPDPTGESPAPDRGNSLFPWGKIERTFMPEDSVFPGALRTVRYYSAREDSWPLVEEIHEYSRADAAGPEEEDCDYFIEETVETIRREPGAASGSSGEPGEVASEGETGSREAAEGAAASGSSGEPGEMASEGETGSRGEAEATAASAHKKTLFRYWWKETDGQARLVRMDFFPEESGEEEDAEAGGLYFTRAYSEDGTGKEDSFYRMPAEAAGESGQPLPCSLTCEEPLMAGNVTPGFCPVEYPWMFRIP